MQRAGSLSPAQAAVSRVLYLSAEDLSAHRDHLCRVWGFRVIGVMGPGDSRRWVLVRPGIEQPLVPPRGIPSRRLVLVFDLNGVLGAKWFDPARRWRAPRHCNARCGAVAFKARPGAAKLLRMCESAGHEVWIWSTMQRATVEAFSRVVAPWLPPGRVLCREDCPEPDTKDLRRVWEKTAIGGKDVPDRTLLLDDDAAKGRRQPGCVRIVPAFAPVDPYADDHDAGALEMLALVVREQLGGLS